MASPSWVVEWPTLFVAADWIEQHCVVPDGFQAGEPFSLEPEGLPPPKLPNEVVGWQLWFILNHYRVKKTARFNPKRPVLGPSFFFRRSQIVMPQKAGKAPITAAQICLEGVGPSLFAGWAKGGESWDCRDHGCDCGWVYEYEPGEAMAMKWPTPLIQITATSEEQTDNIYDALRPMIDNGPLSALIPKTGEEFIRLPRRGRIDVVTSNARSRLGQRVTFVPQDETGIWTPQTGMVKVAETQRRGLAGMGGRSCETTNAWDPNEVSVAKRTAESKKRDIFRLHPLPPAGLDYRDFEDRQKIHLVVYQGSPWVDLKAIEAEASELLEYDAPQAERFFGNRVVAGSGAAFDTDRWAELVDGSMVVPDGDAIVVGVDGARFFDAVAVIATHVESGYQWPLAIIEQPDEPDEDYEHDFEQVDQAMVAAFDQWKVWRVNIDPQYIGILVDRWVERWGSKRIVEWFTFRPRQMAYALRDYKDAQTAGDLSHDGSVVFAKHIGNATKRDSSVKDDEGRPMWLIEKPEKRRKIDAAMAGALSWEARGAAIAGGACKPKRSRVIGF